MTVDRLTQKIKLGDKQIIQDSMRKLITMIAENKKTQEEIIKFLPENEILKIMSYLEDHDPMFRKLTAKFLLELVYSNYAVQQVFCNVLGILPWDGKVCLNQIPESFRKTNRGFPDCIEVVKKTFAEELRENLPYCWYFTPENADQADSQVRFISQDEKKELESSDLFVDPLYAMVGFVVRAPKAKRLSGKSPECADKYIPSYIEFEATKKAHNPKTSNKTMTSINNSLNQSINARSRTNSTSIEKSVFKSVSPVRTLTPGTVTMTTTVGYPKKSKFKTDTNGSSSICNSERLTQNKVPIVTEMSEESHRESIHIGTHYLPGFKRYIDIKDKTSPHRESTLSTETYDYTQNVKLNDSHLETSVSNSISHKGSFAAGLNERSPNIANYKAVVANNEKKGEPLKKNVEKSDKGIKHIKSKPSDLDQKQVFKSLRDNNSFSFSASTTPKNNLLSKVLKDRPASKQSKTKIDQNKKLNTTAASSMAKHVSQKASLGGQKNRMLNKTENESVNKKNGFHPSLMKSIDLNDRSHGIVLGEDRVESAKENVYQDIGDRPQSCKNNSSKNKTYNLSSVLKSSISTPRTPTETLKASLGLSAKILNSRKSQDVSYQSSLPRDKRKSEAFVSFQNIKTKQFDIQDNIIRDSVTEFSPDHGRSVTPKIYM